MISKRVIVCIVLAASIGMSAAQLPSACSTSAGVNSEAFSWLSKRGQDVQIYSTPNKTVPDVCNSLFVREGSCCDIVTLKTKISKVSSDITTRWTQYIGTLGKFRNVIMKALKKLAPFISANMIEGKIAQLNAVGASTKLVDILPLIPRDEDSLKKLVEYINGFEDKMKVYKEKAKGCYNILKSARSNIYCAMCAGNNKDFAKPQTSYEFVYKVDADTCQALVGNCLDTWKFNFNVLTMTQLLTVLKMKGKGTDASTSFRSQMFMNNDAIFEFRKAMNTCDMKDGKIECSADADVNVRKLCSLGFAANKHNGYVEGDASYIADIKDDADTVLEKLVETETTNLATKRLLATAVEPTIRIDVEDRTSNYPNLTKADTGIVVVEGDIDVSKAGEGEQIKASFRLALAFTSALLSLITIA